MLAHLQRLPLSLDPLIAEAKRRARARKLLSASLVVAAAISAGLFLTLATPWRSPGTSGAHTTVGLRNSYVGVACHAGTGCGRIGVALWIAQPADAVWVTLFGRRAELRGRGYVAYRGAFSGWAWVGFVRVPASVYTPDSNGVRLGIVVRRDGATASIQRSVFLSPGWG
jgi:hypothetical protein